MPLIGESEVKYFHRLGCFLFGHMWLFHVTTPDGEFEECLLCEKRRRLEPTD